MKQINGLRFIVGNGCNYNCFYCHHEGYFNNNKININIENLKKLKKFTLKNNISNISITGGEPFLYWENTKKILTEFNDPFYRKTLNSNFSLADNYIDEINSFNNIEFHINLSSLDPNTHKRIIEREYLKKVLKNLEMFRDSKHTICLNIPVIKGVNNDELISLYNYAKERNFIPRFLVLMPVDESLKSNVSSIDNIIYEFGGGRVLKKYSYGLYKVKTSYGEIEIVKCLCDDMECEICKKNTYMHLTPELDIKYCMKNDDLVNIDFESEETIENSFDEANRRLELIKK